MPGAARPMDQSSPGNDSSRLQTGLHVIGVMHRSTEFVDRPAPRLSLSCPQTGLSITREMPGAARQMDQSSPGGDPSRLQTGLHVIGVVLCSTQFVDLHAVTPRLPVSARARGGAAGRPSGRRPRSLSRRGRSGITDRPLILHDSMEDPASWRISSGLQPMKDFWKNLRMVNRSMPHQCQLGNFCQSC